MVDVQTQAVSTTPVAQATNATPARGTSLLDALGLNADDVLKASNVSATIKKPTSTVTNDALGIFQAQEDAAGVSGYQQNYNTTLSNFLNAQNLANQEQLTIQGRAKKLGVLRGEQQQAAGQAQMDLQTLNTAMTLAQNQLASAKETASQRGQILYNEYQTKQQLMLEYPGLKIDPLNDDMSKVSKKLKEYKKDEEKKVQKQSFKDALRDMGLSTKGSRKELEDRLRSANAETYASTKKASELQLKQLELSVAKAQKALNADTWTPDDSYKTTTSPKSDNYKVDDDWSSIYG